MDDSFSSLPLDHKAQIVWEDGIFLESIDYYGYKANLYALQNHFVEVKIHAVNNDVEEIRIITEPDLYKYLNRIYLNLH